MGDLAVEPIGTGGQRELLKVLSGAGFEVKYDSETVEGFNRAFTSDPFGNRIELVEAYAKPLP